jgi:glycosyltransferase involved in cell wall biosynthesis
MTIRLRTLVGGLQRLLPARLRPIVRELVIRMLVPSAQPCDDNHACRITLAGLLTSPSGIGEAARLYAMALAKLGYQVGMLDLTESLGIPQGAAMPASHANLATGDIGGPILLALNPPQFQFALLLRLLQRKSRRLIACWVWEFETMPNTWRSAFRFVHEVWVPTRFVQEALRTAGCRAPVRVVPYPVAASFMPTPVPRSEPGKLRVLSVFAFDSGFDRKNPIAAVAAFREAFGQRTDVELVIKVRGRSRTGQPERRFAAAIDKAINVTVVEGTIDRTSYCRLLSETDVILSLHRTEGFGLVLAEAMLMGKPVIATAWSGNLDFTTKKTTCLVAAKSIAARDEPDAYIGLAARWADPSLQDAVIWLRQLEDPNLRRVIGDAGRRHAVRYFGLESFAAAIGVPR